MSHLFGPAHRPRHNESAPVHWVCRSVNVSVRQIDFRPRLIGVQFLSYHIHYIHPSVCTMDLQVVRRFEPGRGGEVPRGLGVGG